MKKILPNGHEKRVFRRIFITRVNQLEEQPVHYQDISEDRCKPDYFHPEVCNSMKMLLNHSGFLFLQIILKIFKFAFDKVFCIFL